MERRKFKQILLLAGCIIALYFVFQRAETLLGFLKTLWIILTPFVLGGALAFILNVPMRFFETRALCFMNRVPWLARMKRPVALVLVIALAAGICYLLLSLIIPELINTITTIINGIPGSIKQLDEWLKPHGVDLGQYISASLAMPSAEEMDEKLMDMLNLVLKGAAFSGTLIGTMYQNVLSVFFTLMFTIYFLFAKERLSQQFTHVMEAYCKPKVVRETLRIARMTKRTFSSFITGQCLEALILGGLFFVVMTIFQMHYVMLISIFITVTALIPVIGAWIGCIVGALLILMVDPMQALWFLVMFLVVQQIEGNLIYPHVMGNAIGLPSIWVLFAVVLGEGLMGILGMLLFIPLTSVAYALLRECVHRRLEEKRSLDAGV